MTASITTSTICHKTRDTVTPWCYLRGPFRDPVEHFGLQEYAGLGWSEDLRLDYARHGAKPGYSQGTGNCDHQAASENHLFHKPLILNN